MRNLHDTHNIELLLSRFMAGESTLDEERILTEYFLTNDVRPEWQDYKEMFALFAAGEVDVAHEEHNSVISINSANEKPKTIMLRWFMSGIAASIAILFCIYPNITNKNASETPPSVANNTDAVRHCAPTEQQQACRLASTTQVNTLPSETDENALPANTKQIIAAAVTPIAEVTEPSRQRQLEADHIMRLLDEADNAFAQATTQCVMDINESFSQDETLEEPDYETFIII